MSIFDTILLFALLAVSLLVLRWFLGSLLGPLRPVVESWKERAQQNRVNTRLKNFHQTLGRAERTITEAELRKFFFLDDFPTSRAQALVWQQYNKKALAVVRELPTLSEESLRFLETSEQLLQERDRLLKLYADSQDTLEGLRKKRGKDTPAWAKDEFEKKLAECCEDLETNSRDFFTIINRVLYTTTSSGELPSDRNDVTYH